jgi:c-di-GMP-binding flagellar brake protein YcgR
MSKEILLTIEKFYDDEESKFLIHSRKEILLTLRAIAQKRTSIIVYFDNEEQFIKSLLLTATDNGMWIDVGPNDGINDAIQHSENLTFVTLHQGAKVQFESQHPTMATYAAHPAFHFPLPEHILRLQRREFFRLPTTLDTPLTCVIATPSEEYIPNCEITIMDISIGGVALKFAEKTIQLEAGEIYENCLIELPEVGTLTASIKVKNLFDVTTPDGKIIKHAGCEFVQLDRNMSMLLQRYVSTMQSKFSGLRQTE